METVLLVGLEWKAGGGGGSTKSTMEELGRLADTAGARVTGALFQRRPSKDPATLIGKGKAHEIALRVKAEGTKTVVFDDDLTPAQQKNLGEIIPAKILDRTHLILDIFARRAHSREGQMQVELAQLAYLLPRITERFGRFEQQTGGIGTRGPGEKKLEVDQRRVRDRMARLKREISGLSAQRALHRKNRGRVPLPVVALVGYTNVGKSTLLNVMQRFSSSPLPHPPPQAGEGNFHLKGRGEKGWVYADDKLFATLDPTARRVKLPGGRTTLFVDTVGFIQKLPHHLVAAFHATLEEAVRADLLVHVVDAGDPDWAGHYAVVQDVLKDIKADGVRRLDVFNKSDLLPPRARTLFERENRLLISAGSGEGLAELLKAVELLLEQGLLEKEFILPHARRDLLPVIYGTSRVQKESAAKDGTRLNVIIDPKNWGHLAKQLCLAEKPR